MVFSSLIFLFAFLTPLFALYYLLPARFREGRNLILLAFSLFFYYFGGRKLIWLMLASISINYLCGLLAGLPRRTWLRRLGLWLAVGLGLGLLGWFKYAMFIAGNLNALGCHLPVPEITLPIGISFFTFQGLSYVIDVYRGDAPVQKNPLRVALYIALFPQLVAGPIVRYTTVAEEIVSRKETLEDFSQGGVRFLFGLAKKMLLANALGEIADGVFAQSPETMAVSLAWLGALAYTGQIYFDFSAYSDMAIGLGRMFGFHFLENFNYPYISKSITEFWRRWHISLSSWFRDYLYIPLGGNRKGTGTQLRNLLIVWLLTGLWHGANWTFVAWGLWFGLLLMGEKFLWGEVWEKLPPALRHLLTLLLVTISWVLFRSDTIAYALRFLGAMSGGGGALWDGQTVYYLLQYTPELCCAILAALPVRVWLQKALENQKSTLSGVLLTWAPPLLALVLFGLSYLKLVTGSFNPFIYFQF